MRHTGYSWGKLFANKRARGGGGGGGSKDAGMRAQVSEARWVVWLFLPEPQDPVPTCATGAAAEV